jgi:hypothetical protein
LFYLNINIGEKDKKPEKRGLRIIFINKKGKKNLENKKDA